MVGESKTRGHGFKECRKRFKGELRGHIFFYSEVCGYMELASRENARVGYNYNIGKTFEEIHGQKRLSGILGQENGTSLCRHIGWQGQVGPKNTFCTV